VSDAKSRSNCSTTVSTRPSGAPDVTVLREDSSLAAMAGPATGAEPPAPDDWMKVLGAYPQLVMRLFPGIYPRFPIELTHGEPAEARIQIYGRLFSLRHPGVDPDARTLDAAARQFLADAILDAVRTTGRRMCLVLGPHECLYIEPDGRMDPSKEQPSLGLAVIIPSPAS
jgi:hypothetical protein